MRYSFLLMATASAVVLSGVAHAQETTTEDTSASSGLGEITVTAQRREANLQDTPVAVSAFTPEMLENLQVNETLDLANNVPNLTLYTGATNPGMVNLYMRGAGEQIGGLVTSESAVGVYVDDVYNARLSAANLDLVDVERIEVLRGPQGTLYGRNSMTGALKIVTKQADGETWAKASAAYGRFDEVTLKAGGGFELIEDSVGATLSAQYRDQGEGYLYNRATGEKRGKREVVSLRGKLGFYGSDVFSAQLTGFYSDDDNDGLTPVAVNSQTLEILTGGYRTVQSPLDASGYTKQWGGSLDMSFDFGDVTLRSISAYIDVEDGFHFDLSGGVEVAEDQFVTLIDRTSNAKSDQFSEELQLSGEAFGGDLEWILGAFYFREKALQQIDDVLFFTTILPTIIDQKTTSHAVFGQGSYHLTNRLGVTAGLRWTRDEKTLEGQIDSYFGSGIPYYVDRKDSWSVLTPRLELDYEFGANTFSYASISRGFRAGGYNGLTVASPSSFNTPFDPEKVWAYEVGLKTELFDRRVRLNSALFYNQFKDIQQSSTLGAGATAIQNVGSVDVIGLETELYASVVEGLDVFGHFTLQDEDYKTLDPGSVAATQGLGRLSNFSKVQGQIGFTYEYDMESGSAFTIGSDYSYRSNYFSDAANQPINRSGNINLVNGFLSFKTPDRRWKGTFSAKNIFNEKYSKIGLVLAAPYGVRFVNEPTTWQFQVDYQF